ncbi:MULTISPECIES: hypothetical protein [unclassified Streptomyces]
MHESTQARKRGCAGALHPRPGAHSIADRLVVAETTAKTHP